MAQTFPNQIVLGLDARDGLVATHGWLQTSHQTAIEVAQGFVGLPLAGLVFTDIARDGMMNGPNLGSLVELAQAVPIPVIASGGVCDEEHVRQLRHWGMAGAIIGRALYEDKLSLPRALAIAAGRDPDAPQEPAA
jgi:phosphoribosylformimino-5-aminoimidazole carboxamide ribotide isomerase